MIHHCLMWGIWRKRNAHTFEGDERSIHDLKRLFLQTLYEWTNASGVFTFDSLVDLLDCCNFHILQFFIVVSLAHYLCALVFLCYFLFIQ